MQIHPAKGYLLINKPTAESSTKEIDGVLVQNDERDFDTSDVIESGTDDYHRGDRVVFDIRSGKPLTDDLWLVHEEDIVAYYR